MYSIEQAMDKAYAQEVLKKIKCFVFDMDGTIYLESKILDGAIEFLHKLEENNVMIRFFTNNSSKNNKVYVDRITKMGYPVTEEKIFISNHVIITHLLDNMPEKTVFVLGNQYLQNDFKEAGVKLVEENPDIVVVGFDTSLAYDRLTKACTFIRNGATFYGVNPDFNCPMVDGYIPDCGSICALITASTGKVPEFFGKPTVHTLEYILKKTGLKEEEIAIVGDRLYTDIALAKGNKVTSILVLTGESTLEDVPQAEVKPTLIFQSLKEAQPVIDALY
ncbi:HAD-IIA family hydrolase [Propionispora vibrioides]|uniref:Acid sugar phosphatase n=1 Tax=Propionispora vibrioides TaxID=112903 RepID=A0A1H8XAQ8_9FIRM|nr:HAD-IIA family hydrolase [Propionispora vibrioides]SEP36952.1 HAD-superfamily subfamily IIA hydrolase, TIGR01457 [Propionispora vibrioides]